MTIRTGQMLRHYRITEKIGAGGMGEVWRAVDTKLNRDVAVKVLPQAYAEDADRLARFEREARAVAALSHPNILAIHDLGSHEGQAFAVMELLEGELLSDRIDQERPPRHKLIDFAVQIARGLSAAHEKRVVHRDLKPDNIFVTRDGLVKILDFGLARVPEEGQQTPEDTATPTRSALTAPGSVMGTVGYMSPEQARGEPTDARSDIFSLGVVLYEMLSGERAFHRDSAAETMTAIIREPPPELTDVDSALGRVVMHCLEKRPEERFQSARDLVFALEAVSGDSQPASQVSADRAVAPRRRWWPVLGMAAVLVVGIAIGLLVGRPGETTRTSPQFTRLTFPRGMIDAARFNAGGDAVVYSAHWHGGEPELYSVSFGNPEALALGLSGAILLDLSANSELAIQRRAALSSGRLVGVMGRVPMGGTAPRDVIDDVVQADWDPRGDALAVLRDHNYRRILEFPPGNVLLDTPRFADFPRVSPRGDQVALWVATDVGSGAGKITLIDRSGTTTELTDCVCTGIAWTPRGDGILFTEVPRGWHRMLRLTGGETALYHVDLSGVRTEIWRTAGSVILNDIAVDGRILVRMPGVQSGILGKIPGAADERDLSWFDGSGAADLSDDGRVLLFNERAAGGGESGSFYIRQLDEDSPAVRLGEGVAVDLSPDGRSVLAYDPRVPHQFTLVPTGVGSTKTIDIGPMDSVWAWFVPNRREILFNGREPDGSWRFYIVDPDGGAPAPISPKDVDHFRGQKVVSPDGRRFAGFTDPGDATSMTVFRVEGGDPEPVPGIEAGDIVMRWNEDGTALYVFNRDGLPAIVHRVELATGERTPVHSLMPTDPAGIRGIEIVTMTPDARYYVYDYTRRLDALYLIEGLGFDVAR